MSEKSFMIHFRIALGTASCRDHSDRSELDRNVCSNLLFRLEKLKSLSPEQLRYFAPEERETLTVDGKVIRYTTFRDEQADGSFLLVVQAFYSTLWFPNYLSLTAVGRIYAEGIVVDSSGQITSPPEKILWPYR